MHHVIFPLTFVVPAITPCVLSKSWDFIVLEFALVYVACWPSKFSLYFVTVFENSAKNSTIYPLFFSSAMHLITTPLTIVDHTLIVVECPSPFSPIVNPVADIEIFIFVY